MVVPDGIAAGSAESAIATPETQNPAIKSATNLIINRPAPALHPTQLNWQGEVAAYDNRAERKWKGWEFECVAMDRGVAPKESSKGASGQNIFARGSRRGNFGQDLLQS